MDKEGWHTKDGNPVTLEKSLKDLVEIKRLEALNSQDESLRKFIERNSDHSLPIAEWFQDYASRSEYKMNLIREVKNSRLKKKLIEDFDFECINSYGAKRDELDKYLGIIKSLTKILNLFGFTETDYNHMKTDVIDFILAHYTKPITYEAYSSISRAYSDFIIANDKPPNILDELREFCKTNKHELQ